MNSLNLAQLIGNLTTDPVVKTTNNGTIATFSVATNYTRQSNTGDKIDEVSYHNCVVFGWLAKVVEKYAKKGKKVYIQGRMRTRTWEDDSKVKHYRNEIVVEQLILLSQKEASTYEYLM